MVMGRRQRELIEKQLEQERTIKPKISDADKNKRVEELRAKLNQLVDDLKSTDQLLDPIHDVVGLNIVHQKYGIGTIINQVDGKVTIDFGAETKSFAFPSTFVNGFMSCDDKLLNESIINKGKMIEKRKLHQLQIDSIEKELIRLQK